MDRHNETNPHSILASDTVKRWNTPIKEMRSKERGSVFVSHLKTALDSCVRMWHNLVNARCRARVTVINTLQQVGPPPLCILALPPPRPRDACHDQLRLVGQNRVKSVVASGLFGDDANGVTLTSWVQLESTGITRKRIFWKITVGRTSFNYKDS